ncbi:MAG: toll/interleukin-1 receptor domain-containing protein [Proteobacteria bacterium]|nr:toll/interleukin-1 receptor domain-containing protein [Pseudomonadota bacterium]
MEDSEGPGQAAPSAPDYWAFISYSHHDRRTAFALHRQLERFALPGEPRGPRARRRVFIDRAELSAGADLSTEVRQALARSAALVVVASPAAKASQWVAREIEEFRRLFPARPVLTALVRGEPAEAFPAPLYGDPAAPVEPLAADFRKGGDGSRLALLKLVAPLAGLPLDGLIQRDSQRRMRRVMAITAASVALSLGAGGLAFMAIRARAEAEAQRNESEAMVEFMLTDLRDRLKSVGRLDIMGAVNQRAMQHYDATRDLSSLPDDVLERRARLLTAMGEDAMNDQKNRRLARPLFEQSARITADLLRRAPNNPQRIFDHAQNEFWLGAERHVIRDAASKPVVGVRFRNYRDLALRLRTVEPNSERSLSEMGYAEQNLCDLALVPPVEPAVAVQHCQAAMELKSQLAAARPQDLVKQLDLANSMGWQADAETAAGRLQQALEIRRKQTVMVEAIVAAHPDDFRARHGLMLAKVGLIVGAHNAGDHALARSARADAQRIIAKLHAHDPRNDAWAYWSKRLADLPN